MNSNPWIEWSKQAPKESDLPIECAYYGSHNSSIYKSMISSASVTFLNYDLWRPYVCDIPKVAEIKTSIDSTNVKTFNSMKQFVDAFFPKTAREKRVAELRAEIEELMNQKDEPQPDANGWWRIEDSKPKIGDFVLVSDRNGSVGVCTFSGLPNYFVNRYGITITCNIWKPLDMTGPEEK